MTGKLLKPRLVAAKVAGGALAAFQAEVVQQFVEPVAQPHLATGKDAVEEVEQLIVAQINPPALMMNGTGYWALLHSSRKEKRHRLDRGAKETQWVAVRVITDTLLCPTFTVVGKRYGIEMPLKKP